MSFISYTHDKVLCHIIVRKFSSCSSFFNKWHLNPTFFASRFGAAPIPWSRASSPSRRHQLGPGTTWSGNEAHCGALELPGFVSEVVYCISTDFYQKKRGPTCGSDRAVAWMCHRISQVLSKAVLGRLRGEASAQKNDG